MDISQRLFEQFGDILSSKYDFTDYDISFFTEKMTYQCMTQCLSEARQLLEFIESGGKPTGGICANLQGNDSTFLVALFSSTWKYNKGSLIYPVPEERSCGKWERNNRKYRIDLLKHVITEVSQILDDYRQDMHS